LLTVFLSYHGYWFEFRAFASALASQKVVVLNTEIKPSLPMVILDSVVIFVVPAFVFAGAVGLVTGEVQKVRVRSRGIKWVGDIEDYPPIKQKLAQGWSLREPA